MTQQDRQQLELALDSSPLLQLLSGASNSSAPLPSNGSNATNATGAGGTGIGEAANRYWVVVMLTVPMCTIFGNALVVLAVSRERALQTATNRFIVSLAFADILVAAIVMPVSVYVEVRNGFWDFSDVVCDLWIMCDAMFSTASILNLVAISIDRFMAVTRPIQYAKHKNSKRTRATIAATWLLSACIALPIGCGLQNLGGLRRRRQFRQACTFFNADFLIYSSLGSFYIPCCVMLVLYHRIFTAIRRRARKKLSSATPGSEPPPGPSTSDNSGAGSDTGDTRIDAAEARPDAAAKSRARAAGRFFRLRLQKQKPADRSAARRERKATKTLAIVLCVFLLCWLPFFITNLMWAACLKNVDNSFFLGPMCDYDRRINVFIVWLGYMNSFMNPLIYTIFNNEFRKAFKKLLRIK